MTIKEWSYEIKALRDEARHLWGEDKTPEAQMNRQVGGFKQPWRQHLEKMLLNDDPVKYLGENTPDFDNIEIPDSKG